MKTKSRESSGIRRVMIVDDDCAVRESLRQMFDRDRRFAVMSEHGCGKDAIHKLNEMPSRRQADLVLLDIAMPTMDGIECCGELRARFPKLVIAMFTARKLPAFADAAREAGADAYFCKSMDACNLVEELIELRHSECMLLGPGVLMGGAAVGKTMCYDPQLSPRQEKILELVTQNYPVKEIAGLLTMNLQTVYTQLHRAAEKMENAKCGGVSGRSLQVS